MSKVKVRRNTSRRIGKRKEKQSNKPNIGEP
jgi:hypothetical protein